MSYACACRDCGFNFLGNWSYSKEWVWKLGTKIMLHCFRKVKCKLRDTSGSSLLEYNVSCKFLQGSRRYYMSVAQWLTLQGSTVTIRDRSPVGYCLFCLSIAELYSLKYQLCLGLCGQLADYYSLFFSLIHPLLLNEFSFKEMRTRDQSKISSCCSLFI